MSETTEKAKTAEDLIEMWEIWAKSAFSMKFPPMSMREIKYFLSGMEADRDEKIAEDITSAVKDTFSYQVFNKRAEAVGLKLSPGVKVFLPAMLNSPGESTIYVNLLLWKAKSLGEKEIDMEALGRIFPLGFPDEPQLHTMWETQKINSANLLDTIQMAVAIK